MQENTEPHEKEVLKQECLPGASSTIPGRVPQQVPPPDPSGETDWNAEIPQEINYQAFQLDVLPKHILAQISFLGYQKVDNPNDASLKAAS